MTLEGSNAVLECIITCSPSPDITWYKGDKSLMNNRHFENKYDNVSGRAMLTVLNCTKEDSGPYKCVFRNPLGEAESKAALTVRSKLISYTINLASKVQLCHADICLQWSCFLLICLIFHYNCILINRSPVICLNHKVCQMKVNQKSGLHQLSLVFEHSA